MEINKHTIKALISKVSYEVNNLWNGKSVTFLPKELLMHPYGKPILIVAAIIIPIALALIAHIANKRSTNVTKDQTESTEISNHKKKDDPFFLKLAKTQSNLEELNKISSLAEAGKPIFYYEKDELKFLPEVTKNQEILENYKDFPHIQSALYKFVEEARETSKANNSYYSFFCKNKDREGLEHMKKYERMDRVQSTSIAIEKQDKDVLAFLFSEGLSLSQDSFPKGFLESLINNRDEEKIRFFLQYGTINQLLADEFITSFLKSHDKETLQFISKFGSLSNNRGYGSPVSFYIRNLVDSHNRDELNFVSKFIPLTDIDIPTGFINPALDVEKTNLKFISEFIPLESLIELKLIFEKAVESENKKEIQFISEFVPINFWGTHLFAKYQYFKNEPKQNFMIELGYLPSEREKLILKDQFFEKTQKEYPILEAYGKFSNHSISKAHQGFYGKDYAHQEFLRATQESVLIAFSDINEFRKAQITNSQNSKENISFRTFLQTLSGRRRGIADSSGTDKPHFFGKEKKTDSPNTSLKGIIYGNYLDKFKKDVTVTIDSKTYTLTKKIDYIAKHVYSTFWEKDDPVFLHLEEQFKKIACGDYKDAESLGKDIAYFHWLYANIVPFYRGTASIGEVITDAIWLSHGYVPQKMEEGKSIDLEALTSPEFESFLKIYPLGKTPA